VRNSILELSHDALVAVSISVHRHAIKAMDARNKKPFRWTCHQCKEEKPDLKGKHVCGWCQYEVCGDCVARYRNVPSNWSSTPTSVSLMASTLTQHFMIGLDGKLRSKKITAAMKEKGQDGDAELVAGLPDAPISKLACGGDHVLVITAAGEVFGFGANAQGQLGLAETERVSAPTRVELPKDSVPIAIAAGAAHSLILLDNGTCLAAGSNVKVCRTLGTGSTDTF
jgi:hypothetical protein